jgi:hypothetical protein
VINACGGCLNCNTLKKWFNWDLCGKSIDPLFPKAPLVEMLLIAYLRPYSRCSDEAVPRPVYLGRLRLPTKMQEQAQPA